MERWKSKINVNSEKFKQNYEKLSKIVEDLEEKLKQSHYQGTEEEIKRFEKGGRILARDRIELLLDEDSPFLEICSLGGYGQKGVPVGTGFVGGIGVVSGVECMITANIATIKGGSVNKAMLAKGGRISQIARENRLPVIALTQSGGADLREQFEVFHAGGGGFRELAQRSKLGIPSISVVFGSSTAGGAYTPGMSDYVVMVKKKAYVYLGGPPLVKFATGEDVDDESLGGAEMHARVSGVADFLAEDEIDALRKTRDIVARFNHEKYGKLPREYFEPELIEEPFYDADEILGIISDNLKDPYNPREIIARLVDGSKFTEFKPLYGSTIVTGWAKLSGFPIGIIGNDGGIIFSDSANKASQFIQLCNQSNTPILFLHNVTGFMVGKKYEHGGIIKHGSQFINAVSNSGVPHISIVVGSSYGAGNYAMNGRAYHPRFLFSWPVSKCAVMGPEQLGGVLDTVMRKAAARRGIEVDEQKAQFAKQALVSNVEQTSDVYYTSSRCLDDGVIDPRQTRTVISICLSVIHNNVVKGGNLYGVSRY